MPFHSFIPGDVARSADVNDNFSYIMSILGTLSTPGRVQTTTEFLMGARSNVLFTGTFDTGNPDASGTTREYFQIGYNVDYNNVGGTWKMSRFVSNNGASAIRLGDGEIVFLATHETSESLSSALNTMMRIKRQENDTFIYIPRSVSITHNNETPTTMQDYRLTYVPLDSAEALYGGGEFNKGNAVKDATDFGVSPNAKMIAINCNFTADSSAATQIFFYRNEANKNRRYGFGISAGQGRVGSGFGIVPLGTGSYEGEFFVERTANFEKLFAYVVGYYL